MWPTQLTHALAAGRSGDFIGGVRLLPSNFSLSSLFPTRDILDTRQVKSLLFIRIVCAELHRLSPVGFGSNAIRNRVGIILREADGAFLTLGSCMPIQP